MKRREMGVEQSIELTLTSDEDDCDDDGQDDEYADDSNDDTDENLCSCRHSRKKEKMHDQWVWWKLVGEIGLPRWFGCLKMRFRCFGGCSGVCLWWWRTLDRWEQIQRKVEISFCHTDLDSFLTFGWWFWYTNRSKDWFWNVRVTCGSLWHLCIKFCEFFHADESIKKSERWKYFSDLCH